MGACKSKDKNKSKEKVANVSSQAKPSTTNEIIVESIPQVAPKSSVVQQVSVGKEYPIIAKEPESLKNYNIKLMKDRILIHEGIYTELTDVKKIIKDSEERMRASLLNTDLDYPSDFDFILITSRTSSEFPNPIIEKTDISTNLTNNLKTVLPTYITTQDQIEIEIVPGGLEISTDVRQALMEGTNILGSPKYDSDPFEVIVFEKKTNNLIYYLLQDPSYEYVKYFSNFSAHCNGFNKLFISGGAFKDEEFIPTFIEMDLSKLSHPNHIKKLPNLIHPRSWHSMIFVPPKYVYIVGGSNTKAVEVYNTETNEIKYDSNLNESRSEPTLCVVNNTFLYAFCGFLLMHNFVNSIEKCNLKKKRRDWEIVNLKLIDNLVLEPSFFTVAYGKGNSIILIGGHEQKEKRIGKNYIFNQVQNEGLLDNYKLNEMEDYYVCSEKFFCPLDDKVSVLIPSYTSDTIKILYFNSDMGLLYQMKFEAIVESTRDDRLGLGPIVNDDKEIKAKYENFPIPDRDNNI